MNYAPPLRPYLRAIALLGASLPLSLTACSEPPPGKLFDEEGVWSLVQYDIGMGLDDLPTPRKDAFMLNFDAKQKVVTTAACTSEENNSVTPDNSPCRLTPAATEWTCQCFSYAFQEEIMQWQEFPAGTAMPPKVKFDPDLVDNGGGGGGGSDDGTGSGGGEGGESGGAAADITVITVTELPDRADTYDFRPLPTGVFGGNNLSHFIFESRAASKFDQVYGMQPDENTARKAYCEPCVPGSE